MDQKKPNPNAANRPAGGKPSPTKKPSAKAAPAKPGDGFMGWFGRQVGHVKNAVKTDVTKKPAGGQQPAGGAKAAAKPAGTGPRTPPKADAPKDGPGPAAAPAGETVIYREDKVELAELPDRPGVVLRRTIIDEVVVGPADVPPTTTPPAKQSE